MLKTVIVTSSLALLQYTPPPLYTMNNFISFLLIMMPISTTSMSFNFPNFSRVVDSQSCLPGMNITCIQNQASMSNEVLYLSKDGMRWSVGRAYYSEPLRLWDNSTSKLTITDFSTRFTFEISAQNTTPRMIADGMAFFLVPDPSKLPTETLGRDLGLVSRFNMLNASGSSAFVAVEIDSYFYDNTFDSHYFHMGVDVNSVDSLQDVNISEFFQQQRIMGEAIVSYNGATRILNATLVDQNNKIYPLLQEVNLSSHLPERVFIGLSGATGNLTEDCKVYSWAFESKLDVEEDKSTRTTETSTPEKVKWLIGAIVGVIVLALAVAVVVVWSLKKRSEEPTDSEIRLGELGPRRFPHNVLVEATNNFDEDRKLGVGGSGTVYRGFLRETQTDVAVKRIRNSSEQRRREYIAEVEIISRLRHGNLVQLIGWCHDRRDEFFLVYEFMPNGSLDRYLFQDTDLLLWPERYSIALGLASALDYLHTGHMDSVVIHRDIKSANVMLDPDFNAKLGDFGLAKIAMGGGDLRTTINVAGTGGYIAPEYLLTGKANTVSDVYSFGIVVLEIATGKKAIEPLDHTSLVRVLVDWVWELYGRGTPLEAADSRLGGNFDIVRMERLLMVGLWCAHPHPRRRPPIRKAVQALSFDSDVPHLPRTMPRPPYETSLSPPLLISLPAHNDEESVDPKQVIVDKNVS